MQSKWHRPSLQTTTICIDLLAVVLPQLLICLLCCTRRLHNMTLTPFHLAIQVRDIPEARDFYGNKLGFAEGRSDGHWVDFDMFGHQLVVHLNASLGKLGGVQKIEQGVDGHGVPVPHFGVVLTLDQWDQFSVSVARVIDNFIIEPYTRFAGLPGEQKTMFFQDPSGNALEFKAFRDIDSQLFATG